MSVQGFLRTSFAGGSASSICGKGRVCKFLDPIRETSFLQVQRARRQRLYATTSTIAGTETLPQKACEVMKIWWVRVVMRIWSLLGLKGTATKAEIKSKSKTQMFQVDSWNVTIHGLVSLLLTRLAFKKFSFWKHRLQMLFLEVKQN